mmetsp:Transcript_10525/g.27567  ORF Transcript_10525/g.27567 Transcript_10525/m.27567 type:complete len:344 (-) Transcript_10525:82-1113(-)
MSGQEERFHLIAKLIHHAARALINGKKNLFENILMFPPKSLFGLFFRRDFLVRSLFGLLLRSLNPAPPDKVLKKTVEANLCSVEFKVCEGRVKGAEGVVRSLVCLCDNGQVKGRENFVALIRCHTKKGTTNDLKCEAPEFFSHVELKLRVFFGLLNHLRCKPISGYNSRLCNFFKNIYSHHSRNQEPLPLPFISFRRDNALPQDAQELVVRKPIFFIVAEICMEHSLQRCWVREDNKRKAKNIYSKILKVELFCRLSNELPSTVDETRNVSQEDIARRRWEPSQDEVQPLLVANVPHHEGREGSDNSNSGDGDQGRVININKWLKIRVDESNHALHGLGNARR